MILCCGLGMIFGTLIIVILNETELSVNLNLGGRACNKGKNGGGGANLA